jgi:hypothetical protein
MHSFLGENTHVQQLTQLGAASAGKRQRASLSRLQPPPPLDMWSDTQALLCGKCFKLIFG